ncbi:hypothetical protein RFI_06670 [Reticulomyxa filosa]|uniref:Uncharacterized protein n=1 Tax=Reticulomyxa filosa TaxID=46433 RepID=X6NXA0_RETFI|nr:hypothetical protein RFI_06670 [Reticulomyxa filosa]|eukprot:ETO30449.1 hypothetical protein RFI_06670 [Reticulomyxa filosa]
MPRDVKPSNTHNPYHGFLYKEQTRNDCIPVCESCQQRLMLEDVFFQCPKCGPNEIIRVVRGGRLKNVVKNPEGGSTICVECIVRLCVNHSSHPDPDEENAEMITPPQTNKDETDQPHEHEHENNQAMGQHVFFLLFLVYIQFKENVAPDCGKKQI